MTSHLLHSRAGPDEGYIGGQEDTRSMSDNDAMMQVDDSEEETQETLDDPTQGLNMTSDEGRQKQTEALIASLPTEYRYGP